MPDGVYMPALYLVRHGEPALRGVMLGRTDPPLSEAGRAQMSAVYVAAEVVFTSPLRRAVESAELLARGAEIVVLPDLAEIGLGEWDGKSWDEIEAMDADLARRKLERWTEVTPPGGEPWAEFATRVRGALDVVICRGATAAIVGHIAVNACIASIVAGVDPLAFRQEYGQVYEYRI